MPDDTRDEERLAQIRHNEWQFRKLPLQDLGIGHEIARSANALDLDLFDPEELLRALCDQPQPESGEV